jgi:hypothetical protein
MSFDDPQFGDNTELDAGDPTGGLDGLDGPDGLDSILDALMHGLGVLGGFIIDFFGG